MNSLQQAAISKAAHRHKVPLWLVGGPVRDALLQVACKDWDFVCRRARSVARAAARALGAKFITLDEQNRIYRVIVASPQPSPRGRGRRSPGEADVTDRITLDFAELQGKTIEDDLSRRDFTINAMARPFPAGDIVDPFGGRRDLQKKTVRAFSARSFVDDPLRTLRAFRFSAQFQFAIEKRTLRWIKKYSSVFRVSGSGLNQQRETRNTKRETSSIAAERVREELLRLLKFSSAGRALRLMDGAGLLSQVFPEIEACRRTAIRYYGKGGVLKHSFETVENLEHIFENLDKGNRGTGEQGKRRSLARLFPPSLALPISRYLLGTIGGYPRTTWLKWAAFLHDVGKPATAKMFKGRLRFFEHEHVGAQMATRIAQRLRLSRQETQLLGLWVRNHMRTGNLAAAPRITDRALSRYFRDLGEEGVGMILVSLADHYTYLRKSLWGKGKDPVEMISTKLLKSYYEERSKILPARLIDGHVLIQQLKLKPGPLIGVLLEAVQDAQAEGKVTTRENALVYVRGFLRRHPGRS